MKSLFACIIFAYLSTGLNAQINYYGQTKDIQIGNCVYFCNSPASELVSLHNKASKNIGIIQKYKDGSSLGPDFIENPISIYLNDDETIAKKSFDIVHSSFSSEELLKLKGELLTIELYINSSTGAIDDVVFRFMRNSNYGIIKPEAFRKIETALKNNIQFTLTDEGRKLNYIYLGWMQDPNESGKD